MNLNNIEWEEYFMMSANLAAGRSKDPKTQVGAVIVNEDNRIISSGYNGLPNGIPDSVELWDDEDKHYYVCHAELNAILNCILNPKNCTMYTTLLCCSECSKAIIQSGIKKVIYEKEPRNVKKTYTIGRDMLERVGITLKKYGS